MSARKTAAFYDMDGTLLRGNVTQHYLHYALTDPDLASRARRVLELALKGPYLWAVDRIDRRTFNEVFYRLYEGLSEDRLVVMAEDIFEKTLKPKLFPGAFELVENDRKLGRELVLLTGAIGPIAAPVARHFGITTVVATRLEFGRNNLATGKLIPPVMAGPEKAIFVRRFAEANGIDLEGSVAYADDAADLPLLSSVGRAVAVNPDVRLAATARSHRWASIQLDPSPSGPERVVSAARGVMDTLRLFSDKMVAEGEARWADREDLFDRARRIAGDLGRLANQARDAAADRVQKAAQSVTTPAQRENDKK